MIYAFDEVGGPDGRDQMLLFSDIMDSIQRQARKQKFSDAEIKAAFSRAEDDNICMKSEDMITLI